MSIKVVPRETSAPLVRELVALAGGVRPAGRLWAWRYNLPPGAGWRMVQRLLHEDYVSESTYDRLQVLVWAMSPPRSIRRGKALRAKRREVVAIAQR